MRFPIITTRGVIVFPGQDMHIRVGRKAAKMALDITSLQFDNTVVLVSQRNPTKKDVVEPKDLYSVGTMVRYTIAKDGEAKEIVVTGIYRVKITDIKIDPNGIVDGEIKKISDKNDVDDASFEQTMAELVQRIQSAIVNVSTLPHSMFQTLSNGVGPGELTDLVSNYIPFPLTQKQELLETASVSKRLGLIMSFLYSRQDSDNLDREINEKVRGYLDSQQKEFLLREKLKTIKEELGTISPKEKQIEDWRETIKEKRFSETVRERISEEISRYEAQPPISAEAQVARGYIEWLVKLPWDTYTKDNDDISKAIDILDKHHYGLKEVKERIIEHLAVKIKTKKDSAPIITLVGPPGVGKTSLAKSIGEAIGREVIKVSLGGLRDEAEIRGHRRTYVGAIPGKIIQAIHKAKTSNPIILLDEIDKMASDYRGDPTSAMLEVLDPEQNKKFQDHYIQLEYDLSKTMFIATANYYEQIPRPLLDRVELITLDQYTSEEKLQIAKKYIIPESIKEHGLKKSQFKITDKTISFVISRYTREAGVRELQRTIDKLSRKIVLKNLKDGTEKPFPLTEEIIKELLGKEKYSKVELTGKKEIGYVNGMYYSSVGGGTLPIEVTTYPSSTPKISITGSIQDVMNESMKVAMGYLKSNAKKFGINFDFEKNTVQVHVPEGATPKDGPSAGTAFTTALLSALINKTVDRSIALTGEITLRGDVLEIGGLKQKTLGAVENGIKTIFIPEANKKDIPDLAEKVRKTAKIIPVSNYSEIFEILFK